MGNEISAPVLAICGGRHLSVKWLPLASRIGRGAVADGLTLATGCCVGSDALMMSAGLIGGWADRLEILAAFGPGGAGKMEASALSLVELVQVAGASVRWWMGGGPTIPPYARLARRSAALAAYTGGHQGAPMIGLIDAPCPGALEPTRRSSKGTGSGSWTALAAAAGCGRQVIVFWCGKGVPALPQHWGGDWKPIRRGWLCDGWEWIPGRQQFL